MTREELGGRPCDITKEGGKIKIVFHPISPNAKNPDAILFTLKISNADLALLKGSISSDNMNEISERPCDITHEGSNRTIVFHPISPNAKNPKANLFTLKISNADIAKLKKAI